MSKDQWSSEWIQPVGLSKEQVQAKWPTISKPLADKINAEFEKAYNNKMPTHDPYVNPNSHIYYQCGCGAILDPGTRSFASLNNAASNQGWKVRWNKNGEGYQPFCVKCGENIE